MSLGLGFFSFTRICNPLAITKTFSKTYSMTFTLFPNYVVTTKTPVKLVQVGVHKYTNDAPVSAERRLFYIDTHKLILQLQSRGFSQEQSEAICDAFVDVIQGHMEHQSNVLVTKAQQEIAHQRIMSSIAAVKKDMLILEKSEFSALRHDTEKQTMEIARIDNMIKDEMTKLRAQLTLDINLEKSRSKESISLNETHLTQLNGHIDTQIANLRTMFEQYRYDVLKYAGGTVLSCLTVCLGFYRLWSSS